MTPRRVILFLVVPVVAVAVLGSALDWKLPFLLTDANDARPSAAAPGPPASGASPNSSDPNSSGPNSSGRSSSEQNGVGSNSSGKNGSGSNAEGRNGADAPLAAGKPGCVHTVAGALTAGTAAGGAGVTPVVVRRGSGRRVPVSDAAALTAALASARPGDTIELADGRYAGKFEISRPGTAASPITVLGTCRAVLDGGSGSGYAVHLNGADHWRLAGFTVTGAEKGIMTDRTNNTVVSHLTVGNTGAEAVHFGNFSSTNTVQFGLIQNTGKTKPRFGEGLYFGTAKSNWASKSGGKPDASNNNRALSNTFKATTAENIDAKEATSGGVIAGNTFDGSAITGDNFADSVLDLKGVRYRVVDNKTGGASSKLKNGFQTHVITDPASSGCGNIFSGNTFPGMTFAGGKAIELDKRCG